MSTIKYYNNTIWVQKPLKYWNGSSWIENPLKFWNGSSWVQIGQPSLVPNYKIFLDADTYSGTGNWINTGSATANGVMTNCVLDTTGGINSISFNGSSSWIDCGTDASIAGFSGLTASIWFKTSNTLLAGNLLYKSDNNENVGWWVDLRPSYQELGFQIVNSSTNNRKYIGRGNIVNNNWYNLTCTWSGGLTTASTKVYLNNTLYTYATNGAGVGTHLTDLAQPLNIGKSRTGSAAWFNGTIANILVYDRALTATEVAQNYNLQKTRFGL